MSPFTPTTGDEDPIDWNRATAVAEARKAIMMLGASAQQAERFAFMAVDAIAHAGLLLPAGTETRTEWATRLKAHEKYGEELSTAYSTPDMTQEECARKRAGFWQRRFGKELVDVMRREVHTTPWAVAEDQP